MKKNIILNKTLEQYNKKYRNRKYRLLKYTKKQVENFDKQYGHYVSNNKTYGLGFNNYLLKGRKWALIGDTYYEIPRPIRFTWFRNLSTVLQTTICISSAAILTSSVVLPIVLLKSQPATNELLSFNKIDGTNTCAVKANRSEKIPNNLVIPKVDPKTGLTVVRIEDEGFSNISNLESISIPESISSIGSKAFSGCSSIKFTVDQNNTVYKTSDDNKMIFQIRGTYKVSINSYPSANGDIDLRSYPNIVAIDSGAFAGCSISNIELPEYMTTINSKAFADCKSLKTVSIPPFINDIKDDSFNNCTSLTNAYFVDDENTWNDGKQVNDSTINASNLRSGLLTYKNPTDLTGKISVMGLKDGSEVPESEADQVVIGLNQKINLKYLYLQSSYNGKDVVGSKSNGFLSQPSLVSVSFSKPEKVLKIGDYGSSPNLKYVQIPDGTTYMPSSAFRSCGNLEYIDMSDTKLKSLGFILFAYCTNLHTLYLPNCVETIEHSLINGCTNIKSIRFPSTVREIHDNAIQDCNLDTIYIDSAYVANLTTNNMFLCTKKVYIKNNIELEDESFINKYYKKSNSLSINEYKEYEPYYFNVSFQGDDWVIDNSCKIKQARKDCKKFTIILFQSVYGSSINVSLKTDNDVTIKTITFSQPSGGESIDMILNSQESEMLANSSSIIFYTQINW